MNIDTDRRHFRFVEVLAPAELKRNRKEWKLVDGWLEAAESLSPQTPKALLEGDFVAHTADGATFKEVTYKTEHCSVEATLDSWAQSVGRRWGRFDGEIFHLSDGVLLPLSALTIERCS
jgi:hypothetical protein